MTCTLLKIPCCQTAETVLGCGAAPYTFPTTLTVPYCLLLWPQEPVSSGFFTDPASLLSWQDRKRQSLNLHCFQTAIYAVRTRIKAGQADSAPYNNLIRSHQERTGNFSSSSGTILPIFILGLESSSWQVGWNEEKTWLHWGQRAHWADLAKATISP